MKGWLLKPDDEQTEKNFKVVVIDTAIRPTLEMKVLTKANRE
ncbi:hypothetical protein [Gloeothece citriformis]|nr:hypothetical protein [Gloeothece citriformis]